VPSELGLSENRPDHVAVRSKLTDKRRQGSEGKLYGFTAPYTDTKARSTAGRLGN
jgi:hypothetical protein